MNKDELINDWRPEVKGFLQKLLKYGFELLEADNGEETEPFKDLDQMVQCLIATDESWVRVRHTQHKFSNVSFFLVLGNSPGEMISDWNYHVQCSSEYEELLEKVTSEASAESERRGQPKATRAEVYGSK